MLYLVMGFFTALLSEHVIPNNSGWTDTHIESLFLLWPFWWCKAFLVMMWRAVVQIWN
jgi:hypothetical protein